MNFLPISDKPYFHSKKIEEKKLPSLETKQIQEAQVKAKHLVETPPAFEHDEKAIHNFAMLQSGSAITDTKWEGGHPPDAFKYWGQLLALKDFPVNHGLTAEELTKAQNANSSLTSLYEQMTVNTDPHVILDIIKEHCKDNGSCYIPSGWVTADGGHYATLKARLLDNGCLAFSLINYGAGMQYHEVMGEGGHKAKHDYQSAEYMIDPDSTHAATFIQKMTLLMKQDPGKVDRGQQPDDTTDLPSNSETIAPYNDEDLYALLLLYGKEIKSIHKRDPLTHGVTAQRAGTCPMTNTRAATRDVLIDTGKATPQKLKRMQFSLKLASLVEAYKAIKLNPDKNLTPEDSLLANALKELDVRCNKLYPEVLTGEEFALSKALSVEMSAYLDTKKEAHAPLDNHPLHLPPLTVAKEVLAKRLEAEEPSFSLAPPVHAQSSTPQIQLDTSGTTPEKMVEYLGQASRFFDAKAEKVADPRKAIMEMRQFMRSLPRTSGEKIDPFWDKIPKKDIEIILSTLQHLISMQSVFSNKKTENLCRIYECESGLIAFDISAQLAQRVDDLQLGGTFAFALDDLYSNQFFYQDAESYQCIREIKENFDKRSQNKQAVFGLLVHPHNKEDNQSDPTQDYLLKHLLTEKQKIKFCQRKWRKENTPHNSDKELVTALLTESIKEPFLPQSLCNMLSLSAYVHSFGSRANPKYTMIENANETILKLSEEQEDRFINQMNLINLKKHNLKSQVINDHVTGDPKKLENIVFHPLSHLEETRKSVAQSPEEIKAYFQVTGSRRPDYQQLTVKSTLPEHLDEDFRAIEATPQLQAQKSLEWAQYNLNYLSNPLVQTRLFTFLFEYGKIENALKESPEDFLKLIARFQQEVISYSLNNPSEFETFLWAVRVSDYLKQHLIVAASKDSSIDLSKLKMVDTRSLLEKKLAEQKDPDTRALIAKHIIHSFINDHDVSVEEAKKLAIANGIASLVASPNLTSLDFTNAKVMQQLGSKIEESLSTLEEGELNQFANLALEKCLNLKENLEWHMEGRFLVNKTGEFSIDMETGIPQRLNQSFQDIYTKLKNNRKYIESGAIDNCRAMVVVTNPQGFKNAKSAEGCWELTFSDYEVRDIQQKMEVDGESSWYIYQDKESLYGRELETYHLALDHCPCSTKNLKFWMSNKGEVVAHAQSGKHYHFSPHEGWEEIEKQANGSWAGTSIKYLNIPKPTNAFEKEWKVFSERYDKKNIAISTSESNGVLTLQKIEFMRLNLSFVPQKTEEDQFKLMSVEHEGFTLSSESSLPQLKGIKGAFILEDKHRTKKVIIPALSLQDSKSHALDLQTDLNYEKPIFNSAKKPYFSYHVDSSGELIGDSPAADLYLSLLYRGQHDFQLARKCLDRSYKYSNNTTLEWEIADQIDKQKDLSPEGIAFDCLLIARMHLHEKKWTNPADKWNDKEKLLKLGQEKYTSYRAFISEFKEGVSIIPQYLRLTPEQELMLSTMDATKTSTQVNDSFKQKLHNKRLNDVSTIGNFQQEGSWNKEDLNYPESSYRFGNAFKYNFFDRSSPRNSGDIRPPLLRVYYDASNPETNRKSYQYYETTPVKTPGLEYLKEHYIALFEEAISFDKSTNLNCRADLFYLVQNDKNFSPEMRVLAATLLYVLNHPDGFRHISPPSGFQSPRECFTTVFKKCAEQPYLKNEFFPPDGYDAYNPIQPTAPLKPLNNPHLTPDSLSFKLKDVNPELAQKKPLEKLFSAFFTSSVKKVAPEPFALNAEGLQGATKLDLHLLKHYEEGHVINQTTNKEVYTCKNKQAVGELRAQLQKQKTEDQRKMDTLQEETLKLAREIPSVTGKKLSRALLQEVAQKGGQKESIQWGDLVVSLLKRKPQLLSEKNSFIDQSQLNKVYTKLMECCLLQSKITQSTEALDVLAESNELTAYSEQRLGSILNKERTYDPVVYPEFLVYEYAAGKMLQPGQVETLKWAIKKIESKQVLAPDEYQHLLLQFAAGGGKTAVIIPILAQRFATKGFLPVIVNTNELYNVGLQEIPESLRASFKQQMEVLDVDLEHQWSVEEFDQLLLNLKTWQKEEKVLLIKAVSWHAINCAKKMAYAENKPELGKKAQDVLDFLKVNGIKLEDEGHLISSPLQQSIRTYGDKQKIPLPQQKLLMHFYDLLLGRIPGSEELAKEAGISDFSRKEVSEKELLSIQTALVEKIISTEEFKFMGKDALKEYLLQASKKRPPWLIALHTKNPELANLVISSRAFIQTHLPHICKLQFTRDYGTSIHPGDFTAAPKQKGQPTSSHFGDPLLKAALTIQLAEQQGVPAKNLLIILQELKKEHREERKWSKGLTPAEITFKTLLPEGFPATDLETAPLEEISLLTHVQKNPGLIQRYLYEYALPQIEIPSKRIVSTPVDMQEGFGHSMTLSATPGLIETYPVSMTKENARLEGAFEAQVIHTLLKPQNTQGTLLNHPNSAKEFFAEIASHPIFKKMDTLIDSGAMLCQESPRVVIQAYLEQMKSTNPQQAAVCFDGGDLELQSDDDKLKDMRVNSSKLVQELKKKGIKHEDLALFLFMDLSKTTGADVKQKYSAQAGLTIGKNQTVTTTIQAAMRERQLLWDDAQTVHWMMLQALYEEINPGKEFDPKALFYWMIRNEGEEIKSKLVTRAYQGIQHVVTQHIWTLIDKGKLKYEDYKDKLEESTPFNPFNQYEVDSTEESTAVVLENYKKELCAFFKISTGSLSRAENANITEIVKQTSGLVEKIASPKGAELNAQVTQEQHVEHAQEQQQQQQQQVKTVFDGESNFNFRSEEYTQAQDGISADFMTDKMLGLEGSNYKPYTFDQIRANLPELIVHKDNLSPLTNGDSTTYTKPIKNLLVKCMPDGSYRFLACTAAGAAFYQKEIARLNDESGEKPKYALIGFDGQVLCSSGNITSEEKVKLEGSTQVAQMTTYTAFLNGQIKDPYILRDIVKTYGWSEETYKQLITAITNRHVSRHPVKLATNSYFEMLCGWKKVDILSPLPIEKSVESSQNVKVLPMKSILQPTVERISKATKNALEASNHKGTPPELKTHSWSFFRWISSTISSFISTLFYSYWPGNRMKKGTQA